MSSMRSVTPLDTPCEPVSTSVPLGNEPSVRLEATEITHSTTSIIQGVGQSMARSSTYPELQSPLDSRTSREIPRKDSTINRVRAYVASWCPAIVASYVAGDYSQISTAASNSVINEEDVVEVESDDEDDREFQDPIGEDLPAEEQEVRILATSSSVSLPSSTLVAQTSASPLSASPTPGVESDDEDDREFQDAIEGELPVDEYMRPCISPTPSSASLPSATNAVAQTSASPLEGSSTTTRADPLTSPQASSITHVVAPPPTPAMDLSAIRQKAAAITPSTTGSTQSHLAGLIADVKNAYAGATVTIKAELAKTSDGDYRPEEYRLPSKPDVVYYKTEATYTIQVEKDGVKEEVKVKRNVYTLATDPSTALLTAMKYAETVSQLALGADGTRIEGLDDAKRSNVMNQSMLQFVFVNDASGKPTQVKEVKAKETTFKLTAKEKQSCVYDYETHKFVRSGQPRDKHQIQFSSEEEAIMYVRHPVNDADLFARWAKDVGSAGYEGLVEAKHKEIQQAENRLLEAKEQFFEEPFLSFLGREGKTKKAFNEFIAGARYLADGVEVKGRLSAAMVGYVQQRKQLTTLVEQQLGDKPSTETIEGFTERAIEQLKQQIADLQPTPPSSPPGQEATDGSSVQRTELEGKLKAIQDAQTTLTQHRQQVENEQQPFNEIFKKFERLNQDFANKVEALRTMAKQAQTAEEDQHEASKAFLEVFSEKEFSRLEATVDKYRKIVDGVLERLEPIGAGDTSNGGNVAVPGGGTLDENNETVEVSSDQMLEST